MTRCIDSIIQNTKIPYELVLVVQGDVSDRLGEYLFKMYLEREGYLNGRVKLIHSSENIGVTPGRNLGMEKSSGDYLLFFDDDAFIEEKQELLQEHEKHLDWLGRMLQYFWDDSRVGIVSPSGSFINPKTPGVFWEAKRGEYCDVGQGYCFMFSSFVKEKIGLLDPYFGKFWHEESEYALRAKDAGFKVVSAGYIGVYHRGSGSGDDGTYVDKINYIFKKWSGKFDTILERKF